MEFLPVTTVLLQTENGTLELRPLKMGSRARFLEYRAQAYRVLQEDTLTQYAAERGFLPAFHCALQNPKFAHAVEQMLALHGVGLEQVDTQQTIGLLFSYQGGDGLLVQLEFPPMPTDGKPLDPGLDPYHYLIALLYYRERDLAVAKMAVDGLTYSELTGTLKALEAIAKQSGEKSKPAPTPATDEERAELLAKVKERFSQFQQPGAADPGLAAIQNAMARGVE